MDLFDVVKAGLGGVTGGSAGSGQAALLNAVMGLIGGQGGGLGGLVQAFEKQGLGQIVGSWVSTGQNLPISPDQIQKVLGSGQLAQFAAQAGVAPDSAGNALAQLLPSIVDKLTPDGKLPAGNTLPGLDVLSQLLK